MAAIAQRTRATGWTTPADPEFIAQLGGPPRPTRTNGLRRSIRRARGVDVFDEGGTRRPTRRHPLGAATRRSPAPRTRHPALELPPGRRISTTSTTATRRRSSSCAGSRLFEHRPASACSSRARSSSSRPGRRRSPAVQCRRRAGPVPDRRQPREPRGGRVPGTAARRSHSPSSARSGRCTAATTQSTTSTARNRSCEPKAPVRAGDLTRAPRAPSLRRPCCSRT